MRDAIGVERGITQDQGWRGEQVQSSAPPPRERDPNRITRAYDLGALRARPPVTAAAERPRTAEATLARWTDRATTWLRDNPQLPVGTCAALAAVGLTTFLALRRWS